MSSDGRESRIESLSKKVLENGWFIECDFKALFKVFESNWGRGGGESMVMAY